jgi:hypothetical protein
MAELPRHQSYGDPDCGHDHDHDAECYPRLRATPGYSDLSPQQKAARESVRARRRRAFDRDRQAARERS